MYWLVLVMDHTLFPAGRAEFKFLVVVLLIIVNLKVGAIKVKETLGEYAAGKSFKNKCRMELAIAPEHWKPRTKRFLSIII